jgi:imidazolonepropionase-like amidohydrolase
MILKGANIFILEENGFVVKDIEIKDGKIVRIGEDLDGEEIEYCKGKYITPGLIDAHSHIGMWEEGIGIEGADGNEMSSPVTPELRAIDGINPEDIAFEEALSGGVTTVATGPGSTNVIGGQFVTIKLKANVIDDMIIKEPSAMKCAFGENPKKYFGQEGKPPFTRMGIASTFRTALNQAKDYNDRKVAAGEDMVKRPPYDEKMENLIPVINGDIPMKAHVHRADDIVTAIRLAKEYKINITLDHCTEGHLIKEKIKESGFPAILGPSFGFKTKNEIVNKTFKTAKILNDEGVKIAIMTDHPVTPQSSLIMWVALAVKAGLKEFEALKAVTINPAEILGIDDRVGSIEAGKDGDLVIWDRNPLDIQASVVKTIIEGKEVFKIESEDQQ